MKILLLIGMQVDLLPDGAAEVPGSDALVPKVNELMAGFELIVAANYWLPAGHLLFAANHPWRKPGQIVEVEGHPALLQTMFCVQESFGAEFIPGLKTEKIKEVFQMGTEPASMPFSAFNDAGKERPTGLSDFLQKEKVTEIYIAGMPLENEVQHTAMGALSQGYKVFLMKNACLGRDELSAKTAIDEIKTHGGQVIDSLQNHQTI